MMILQSFYLGQVNNNHSAMPLLVLISLFHSCFGRQVSILYQDREGERRNWNVCVRTHVRVCVCLGVSVCAHTCVCLCEYTHLQDAALS